jgi:uncharacterized iron-regulated membrane protein
MTVRTFAVTLHRWLGLITGLVVFIVATTGALYVFEEELQDLFDRDVRFVASQPSPMLPPSEALARMQARVGPEYGVLLISYPNEPRTYHVWAWNRNDLEDWIGAYMNPYTGEFLEVYNYHDTFWATVEHLHTTLLLPHEIGRIVVGSATIIFVILLLTGLILWWPRNRRVWTTPQGRRSRFRITWGLGPKRLTYDLHNVLGFYASWIVVFLAITGLVMAFGWMKSGVYWLFSGGQSIPEPPRFELAASAAVASRSPEALMDSLYLHTLRTYPDAHMVIVRAPATPNMPLQIDVYPDEGTFYRRIEQYFDPYTGEKLATDRFEEGNLGDKVLRMNYDIHSGAILGWPGRLLAFFACLIVASLPITGFLIWFPRWRRQRRSRRSPATTRGTAPRVRPTAPPSAQPADAEATA